MATVQIRNIKKSYGETEVVHGIDIDIADGEFIVIVGPSGCGKSTLLRMVAGLESISDGEILIDGQVVNKLEPKDRNIAMVFQNYALYPHMSVFKNMAYGLQNRGMNKDQIREKVEATANKLELNGLLDRKPSQLSGGQRQRVAMGRAIVRNPKVFLFDEPLSNLDAKLRVNMRIEIRRLQRELGITTIYVTHDQVEAMTLADRLVAMNGGYADQIGAPMEIYQQPASMFVAGFIGSPPMNFLNARAVNGRIMTGEHNICAVGNGTPSDDGFTVGLRPEHLEMVSPEGAPIVAKIDIVEPLGAETLFHATLLGMQERITIRQQGASQCESGDTVGLRADTHHIQLFDDNGKSIPS